MWHPSMDKSIIINVPTLPNLPHCSTLQDHTQLGQEGSVTRVPIENPFSLPQRPLSAGNVKRPYPIRVITVALMQDSMVMPRPEHTTTVTETSFSS